MRRGGRIERGDWSSGPRAPKDAVHLAFCIAYVGSAFRGLQLQGHSPMHHTVEGIFVQALKAAGVLIKLEHGRIADTNHFLGRSCRTDRGVHAIRNLVSLYIPTERFVATFAGDVHAIQTAVNEHLPPPIRVVAVTRVMPTFSSKNCCNRRVYRYIIPAYALMGPKFDTWTAYLAAFPDATEALNTAVAGSLVALDVLTRGESPSGWAHAVRDKIAALNADVTSKFVGSHRFHNYTADTDPSGKLHSKAISSLSDESLRVITRCEIAPKILFLPTAHRGPSNKWLECMITELRGAEEAAGEDVASQCTIATDIMTGAPGAASPAMLPYVVFQVEGASFLLNMIRKMVGVVLAVARGTRPSLVEDSLSPSHRVSCPMAPGSYLSLNISLYQGYDAVARTVIQKRLARLNDQQDVPCATKSVKEPVVYSAIEDSWNKSYGAEPFCANFFKDELAAEVVDADLNQMVPLDTALFLRDAYRAVCADSNTRIVDTACDNHLSSMKEYVRSKPVKCPPAASEMTIFLRLLRVHNWNLRDVPIPPNSKVANEVANKLKPVVSEASQIDDAVDGVKKRPREELELPDMTCNNLDFCAYDDGWLYCAATPQEEAELRRAYGVARHLSTRKMRREWGQKSAALQRNAQAVDAVGSVDDSAVDDDDVEAMLALERSNCVDGD